MRGRDIFSPFLGALQKSVEKQWHRVSIATHFPLGNLRPDSPKEVLAPFLQDSRPAGSYAWVEP